MNFTSLTNENKRAVSPVIGVILMVAITVILAAVIGSMVMGFSDSLGEPTPTTSLEVSSEGSGVLAGSGPDSAEDVLIINHKGGDGIDFSELEIRVSHATFDFTETTNDGAAVDYDEMRLTLVGSGEKHEDVNGGNITLSYSGPSDGRLSIGDYIAVNVECNLEQDGIGGPDPHGFDYGAEGEIWEIQLIHDPSDFILLEESVEVK